MGTQRHVMLFDAPLERVFASWQDPDQLAEAFGFIESASVEADRYELEYRGLMGKKRTLELAVTERVEERCIAWRGGPSSLNVSGSVAFDAKGSKTYVTFVLGWRPPLGRVGDILGLWFGYPQKPLAEGLERFAEISRRELGR